MSHSFRIGSLMQIYPPAIITDQCGAITAAVRNVFPDSRHRFCIWHIMNKAPVKLPTQYRKHMFFYLKLIVYDSKTPAEFDRNWQGFLLDFDLQNHSWLKSIYAIRESWIPAFVGDFFSREWHLLRGARV